MSILVIAEHDNVSLKSSTFACVAAANLLLDRIQASNSNTNSNFISKIDVLIAGLFTGTKVTEPLKNYSKINKLLLASNKCYEHGLAEDIADLINTVAKDYEYIIFPATTYGKNIAPRLAALLDVNLLTDVIAIIDQNTFKRPIYAGNALATIRLHDKIKIFSIRTTCFEQDINSNIDSNNNNFEIINLEYTTNNNSSRFIQDEFNQSTRPDLATAKIVVSGGRALQNQENFKLIEQLADKLNAAVGASRAAVDSGYAPNDYQVGQTGKVVAPDLYFAIGISGAIQHVAGILGSKVIVAINKDPEAAIFKISNYGLVGDLFSIVPELIEKVAQLKR